MAKQNKAAKPLTFWFDSDTEDQLCGMIELGVKDNGRQDNPWRALDRFTRGERETVIASLTERISDKITEQCARFETIARATRARSNKRELFEQEVMAERRQTHFTSVRAFALWLARERPDLLVPKVVDKEPSEKQLQAFQQKVRRVFKQNPQASPRNRKKV